MIDKQHKIRKGFNLLAPFYDLLKFPFTLSQPETQIKLLAPRLQKDATHLIIGVGTGKYASILKKETHPQKIVCVDISDKMLELTKRKIGSSSNVFLNADILDGLKESNEVTYLHLPFILDCLSIKKINLVIDHLSTSQYRNIILQDFNYAQGFRGKLRDRLLHFFFLPILSMDRNFIPDLRQILLNKGFLEVSNIQASNTFTSVFQLGNNPQ